MEMEIAEGDKKPVVSKKGVHLLEFAQPSTIYNNRKQWIDFEDAIVNEVC